MAIFTQQNCKQRLLILLQRALQTYIFVTLTMMKKEFSGTKLFPVLSLKHPVCLDSQVYIKSTAVLLLDTVFR